MKYFLTILTFLIIVPFVKAQNILFIEAGASIKTTDAVIITLDNMNLQNNGTINQAIGEGVFRFAGNSNATISGNNIAQFSKLELAKTGGSNLELLQSIKISEHLNFETGILDMLSRNITLSPTALLLNESENSRITASQNGTVSILVALNTPVLANPGNLGAIISSSQNLGFTIIRRGHLSQTNGGGGGNSTFRYYDILPVNNASLNASLRFHYFDAELNGLAENTLTLWKSPNNTNWLNMGFSGRDAIINYVEQAGLADFSRWTLSSVGNALPVHFILFTLNCQNNTSKLNWKTAQEVNSLQFAVQKSNDGINFTTIATIPAAGNSSVEKSYSFTDSSIISGMSYYRIAEIDIDGSIQYTGINRTDCGFIQNEIRGWPNPAQQQFFIQINTTAISPVIIKAFDSKGALVTIQSTTLLQGSNQLSINTSKLAAGIYTIAIECNRGQTTKTLRMVKQ